MIKKIAKILIIIVVIASLIFGAFCLYASDYYHADDECISAFLPGIDVERRELDNGSYAYVPEDYTVGVVFYPGGKVEHTAYEPLMRALADRGILAVLIKMPFNLAFFDSAAAERVVEEFPGVKSWYISGHSHGGAMAASYAAKKPGRL